MAAYVMTSANSYCHPARQKTGFSFSCFFALFSYASNRLNLFTNSIKENGVKKEAKDHIILALDVSHLSDAGYLVNELVPHVGYFKIGLELMTAEGGPNAIDFLHARGGNVFYDGKFNDISNTVGKASKAVSSKNVSMFNLHASSGPDAITAAVENSGDSLVFGVTVLTSLSEAECVSIFGATPGEKALQFCDMLVSAGADGIICSPQELEFLNHHDEGKDLLRMTPGVRPRWYRKNDQKRVMTPAEAVQAGADYLVIGRPITSPPKNIGTPVDAAKRIAEEIQTVLQ